MVSSPALEQHSISVTQKGTPPWVADTPRAEKLHQRALDRGTNSRRYNGRIPGVTAADLPLHRAIANINPRVGHYHTLFDQRAGHDIDHPFDDTRPHRYHPGQEFRLFLPPPPVGTPNGVSADNGDPVGAQHVAPNSPSTWLERGPGGEVKSVEHFITIVRPYTAYRHLRYRITCNGLGLAITEAQLHTLLQSPVGTPNGASATNAAPTTAGEEPDSPSPCMERGLWGEVKTFTLPRSWRNIPINIMHYSNAPWCQPVTNPVGTPNGASDTNGTSDTTPSNQTPVGTPNGASDTNGQSTDNEPSAQWPTIQSLQRLNRANRHKPAIPNAPWVRGNQKAGASTPALSNS